MEHAAKLCAFASAMKAELHEHLPVHTESLYTQFTQKLESNDTNLVLELQSLLLEQNPQHQWSDIQCLRELSSQHVRASDLRTMGYAKTDLVVETLDQDEFELLMKKLDADANLANEWREMTSNHESRVYYKDLEAKQALRMKASGIADLLTQGPTQRFFMSNKTKPQDVVADVQNARNRLLAQQHVHQVHFFIWLNWACPSILPSAFQKLQSTVLGLLLNGDMGNDHLGLVISPVYAGRPMQGSLYQTINFRMESLATNQINTDKQFVMCFSERLDARDERPMICPGHIAYGMKPGSMCKPQDSCWKKTPIVDKQIVGPVTQTRSRNLVMMKYHSDSSLPGASRTETHVKETEKHHQLGPSALEGILDASIRAFKDDMTARAGILVVDLHQRTCELPLVVAQKLSGWSVPVYYIGLVDDARNTENDSDDVIESEWCEHFLHDELTHAVLTGSVKVPGVDTPIKENNQIAQPPEKPTLNVALWQEQVNTATPTTLLKVPDHIMTKWNDHPVYGGRLHAWIEQQGKQFAEGPGIKREAESHASPAVVKKQKTDVLVPTVFADKTSMGTMKHDVPVVPGVSLRITEDNRIYFLNTTDDEISIQGGQVIADYGPGKWVKKDSDENPCIPFVLTTANDHIMYEGSWQMLGPIIYALREKPELTGKAAVRYHDIQPKPMPQTPGWFTLALRQRIAWQIKDSNHKALANYLPCWTTELTDVYWVMRLTQKGLEPVRPIVLASRTFKIPGGKIIPSPQTQT